eukprot:s4464_g13.t1
MEAPPPTGMGSRQLRDWIVLRAFKKTAIKLHPDKSPEIEKEMATVRMQALANAKEILLNPGLRILHDNILGLGVGTGGTMPPPPSAAPDGGSGGTAPHHGWWQNKAPPPKAPPQGRRWPPPFSGQASGPGPSEKGEGKGKQRRHSPWYETDSDPDSSGYGSEWGPATDDSGPDMEHTPRFRAGRILRR